MEKRNGKKIFIVILLLLITNLITFGLSQFIPLVLGNKVLISTKDFNKLDNMYKDYSKIEYIENIIDKEYYKEPEKDKYIDGVLKGLVASLEDPYSVYLTEDEYNMITEDTEGVFGGIGVIVSPGEDNLITIVSPIEGTPGEKAGLQAGDKIIKVEGKEFLAEDMDKAVKLMKGKPGTDVELTIMRENAKGLIDLKITREEIRVDSVTSTTIDDLGYIKLKSFDELSYDEFKSELDKLKANNIKGLIIDLRNNPGGLLDSCAAIADELIGEGNIVYTEDRQGNRKYIESDKNELDLPMAILINEGSASASEILSGAIRDHEKGVLVGTTTFGKGLVQNIRQLPDGSGLKLTISEYFTPNGVNIHGKGIEPDYEVELPEGIEGIGPDYIEVDKQLKKAIEVLNKEI